MKRDPRHWEPRLVHRAYGQLARPWTSPEFSVRIEHEGTSYFFPLGSDAKEVAAARALEIHQAVLTEGWSNALRRYPREFTLAIFWAENPMIFTYTTLYTAPDGASAPRPKRPQMAKGSARVSVAIVEPDDGCRRALADWIGTLAAYSCRGLFRDGMHALAALARRPVDLALFNRQLPDLAASEFANSYQQAVPDASALGYRIYGTSDDLFVSQPGVSGGYYFRRRPPKDLLEPIRDAGQKRRRTPAEWHASICRYVSKVLHLPLVQNGAQGPSPLTAREHDILSYLCEGGSDKEIANALNISVWTVHTHLKKTYEKLGAHSRTEAVIKYLQK